MAVWEIPQDQIIDYSANGDDVDLFSQKVKFCLENIYECVQHLHSNGARAGLDGEATPYEIRVNTSDGFIYMRNRENNGWIVLGEVANYFGLTPEIISAVRNGGGVGRLMLGADMDLPREGNTFHDLYFAQDSARLYIWTGSEWRTFITDTANSISDIPVDVTGISNGDVLQYDVRRRAFVPVEKDVFTEADVTTTGERNKLVRVSVDGKIHADIVGSATKICLIPVKITDIDDGQVLRYHSSTKDFRNEEPTAAVGSGKSLILRDGDNVLGDYNGTQKVEVDLQELLSQTSLFNSVAHVSRLVENLYLALNASSLNPGGYDGLSGETFYGDTTDIDNVEVNVLLVIAGDDTVDVDSIEGLIEGSSYVLRDATKTETVKVKHIIVENGINHLILYNAVTKSFSPNSTKLVRSTCTIAEGAMSGNGAVCVTQPIPLINEVTGETTEVRHAHLIVKHQNVMDAVITAEIALRDGATFVKDEVIGIGNGGTQTVMLAHTDDVTAYKFALYFDGERQESGFRLDPILGQVTFTAASDVIVYADYFYNWSAENFVPMTKTGTYPDIRDQTRATTQFVYDGAKGTVATIRLTLKQGEGTATNEIISTGTGQARGFKLKHKAISSSVSVSPTPTSKSFNSAQNTVIVNSPTGREIKISYRWKGEAFSVESFACTFNE